MSLVFLDVDTQVDFIMPHGALYVPGAEQLLPLYGQISRFALEQGIPVMASADAHDAADPEFAQFPAHCIKGTAGQLKVPQTLPNLFYVHENDGAAVDEPLFGFNHVVFEKQTFDVFSNPKIEAYLKQWRPQTVVVYGVATEYCVKAAVQSLLQRHYGVWLLTDAIKAVRPENGQAVLKELQTQGARLMTFEQLKQEVRKS